MSIAENLKSIESGLNDQTTLVAVSKTHPVKLIREAYDAGQRDFGENKVQELCDKQPQLPEDIRWHLIGHLQTNKVKYIAPFVHLIHAVDSLRLLSEINKRAANCNRVIGCLLQIHIAKEETKFGLSEEEALSLLSDQALDDMAHVSIKGLMGMATFTNDEDQVAREFNGLKQFYDTLKTAVNHKIWQPEILSMGMSGDYLIAQANGSTMVRVGSAIFGNRNYH
ncbi:MAG: YggS family pyridoxal phosphate-dependent enzyme [Flavobacteriales bacterium]